MATHSKDTDQQQGQPPQHQRRQPGREWLMRPRPEAVPDHYRGSGKLEGRVALITGGDSGIGRSTAVLFAREGADVAISYLEEHKDAEETRRLVEREGRRCILLPGDLGNADACREVVEQTVTELGGLDILVNNAAEQHPQERLEDISPEQLEQTFRTNIFAMFWVTQAALEHMAEGDTIINTTSVTAYKGKPSLIDYSSTKGAIVAFTRSLSQQLAERGIRVNGVAPGPIWTPLIPSTFDEQHVEKFGTDTPLGRAGQPWEVATCFVFLASDDSSYVTGETLHVNGGQVVNS